MIAYLDDKIIDEQQRLFLGPGFFWGYGLFETILIKEGNPVFLEDHLSRLARSAKVFGLQLTETQAGFEKKIIRLLADNQLQTGAVKITLFKGQKEDHILLTADNRQYETEVSQKGMALCFAESVKNENSVIVQHKTLQYLENIFEKKKATAKDYDDAIFLNSRGYISESTVANIFFVSGRTIHTPDPDCGILPGIVRSKVLALAAKLGFLCLEGKYTREFLMSCDAVFITNSLMGVMPVRNIDGTPFSVQHEIIAALQKEYALLFKEEQQMNYIYILECADGTYYTGWTNDLENRIRTHNEARGAKYTRGRLPVKLVYSEVLGTREVAMKREYEVKKMTKTQKKELIQKKRPVK